MDPVPGGNPALERCALAERSSPAKVLGGRETDERAIGGGGGACAARQGRGDSCHPPPRQRQARTNRNPSPGVPPGLASPQCQPPRLKHRRRRLARVFAIEHCTRRSPGNGPVGVDASGKGSGVFLSPKRRSLRCLSRGWGGGSRAERGRYSKPRRGTRSASIVVSFRCCRWHHILGLARLTREEHSTVLPQKHHATGTKRVDERKLRPRPPKTRPSASFDGATESTLSA